MGARKQILNLRFVLRKPRRHTEHLSRDPLLCAKNYTTTTVESPSERYRFSLHHFVATASRARLSKSVSAPRVPKSPPRQQQLSATLLPRIDPTASHPLSSESLKLRSTAPVQPPLSLCRKSSRWLPVHCRCCSLTSVSRRAAAAGGQQPSFPSKRRGGTYANLSRHPLVRLRDRLLCCRALPRTICNRLAQREERLTWNLRTGLQVWSWMIWCAGRPRELVDVENTPQAPDLFLRRTSSHDSASA